MTTRSDPLRTDLAVFGGLLILLAATVLIAQADLGVLNTAAAVSIATVKALLVALYFMHLRRGSRVTWVFAASGVLWLSILIGLTLTDFRTRHWLELKPPAAAAPQDLPDATGRNRPTAQASMRR